MWNRPAAVKEVQRLLSRLREERESLRAAVRGRGLQREALEMERQAYHPDPRSRRWALGWLRRRVLTFEAQAKEARAEAAIIVFELREARREADRFVGA